MKIGILTLVPYDNYGGILQGYALQTTLDRMGHNAYILRTKLYNYQSQGQIIKNTVKLAIKKYILRKNNVPYINIYQYKNYIVHRISPFISNNIKFTRQFKSSEDLYKFVNEENFDAFVVGSDQTWRPNLSPDLYHMFIDFLPVEDTRKRIAYAASFGVDYNDFTSEQLNKCKPLLQLFDAVSVREKSGVRLCRDLFGVDADNVLDPTMLLDKEDYLALIKDYTPIYPDINFMQYVFFFNHEENQILAKVSNLLEMKPTNLMTKRFLDQVYRKNQIDDAVFYPVEEWIYCYSHSKFVITDSFHGTVFCLIFNVPFLVVSPEAPTRLQSLLETYGLEDRLIMKENEITKELLLSKIDWNIINQKCSQLKTQSILYLTKNLKTS